MNAKEEMCLPVSVCLRAVLREVLKQFLWNQVLLWANIRRIRWILALILLKMADWQPLWFSDIKQIVGYCWLGGSMRSTKDLQ